MNVVERAVALGKVLTTFAGVSGVWVRREPPTLWIAVRGLTEEGHRQRLAVYRYIEDVLYADILYGVDYYLLVDDPDLPGPRLPPEAESVAA